MVLIYYVAIARLMIGFFSTFWSLGRRRIYLINYLERGGQLVPRVRFQRGGGGAGIESEGHDNASLFALCSHF